MNIIEKVLATLVVIIAVRFDIVVDAVCGRNLSAPVTSDGEITSTNYPQNYHNNACYYYLLQAKTPQEHVSVSFPDFVTEECCDHLTIYDGDTIDHKVIKKLNGNISRLEMYNSTGEYMLLEFITDATVNARGFRGVYASNPGVVEATTIATITPIATAKPITTTTRITTTTTTQFVPPTSRCPYYDQSEQVGIIDCLSPRNCASLYECLYSPIANNYLCCSRSQATRTNCPNNRAQQAGITDCLSPRLCAPGYNCIYAPSVDNYLCCSTTQIING